MRTRARESKMIKDATNESQIFSGKRDKTYCALSDQRHVCYETCNEKQQKNENVIQVQR